MSETVTTSSKPQVQKFEATIRVTLPGSQRPQEVHINIDAYGNTDAIAKAELVWLKAVQIQDIRVRRIGDSGVIVAGEN